MGLMECGENKMRQALVWTNDVSRTQTQEKDLFDSLYIDSDLLRKKNKLTL